MTNYILKDENAVYYECGFSCDNEIFMQFGSDRFFITDGRYSIEAKEKLRGIKIVESRDVIKKAAELLTEHKIKKLHYDPNDFTVAEFEKLKASKYTYFEPAPAFSQKKRIIKSNREIKLIKEAVRLGAEAFDQFAGHLRRYGLNQNEKRLVYECAAKMQNYGDFALSFEPIVAINENAAKPHALPTDTEVKIGSLILVDAGLKYERYCSDRTRVAEYSNSLTFDKKKQRFLSSKRQKVYDTVRKAQEKAIKAAKPGVKACDIDRAAREVIEKAGYGKYFVHSTGHGVGLDIHELPVISAKSETIIEENMIFTVEPGIYLPGEFGVRIEDMVRMAPTRAVVL
ncbi:MAG: X-Pro aminopeptidase [Sulfurospirillum sp.]|nr:MAG: X-Pro aminopeptidase [Sulfurospirillum sp.]